MSHTLTISPARTIHDSTVIEKHLLNPKNVAWLPASNLLSTVSEHCVDGRSTCGVIGTPGGNMGEFILALDAAEKITNTWIRPEEVSHIFEEYLTKFGRFYMHTDTHSLHHLLDSLLADKFFQSRKLKTTNDLLDFIKKPDLEYRDVLLDYLCHADNIGCGHLKLMLKYKNEYGVRIKLIQAAIKAFYVNLWYKSELIDFVVLEGDHHEGAVVVIKVESDSITNKTLIPSIASKYGSIQMFISTPQAESFLREHAAAEIAKHHLIYGINPTNLDQFKKTIIARGQDFTRFTLSHLALGLPHYVVTMRYSTTPKFQSTK